MIKRPDGLVYCETELIFNSFRFSKFEIDIGHINIGKNKTRSTALSLATIVEIAEEFINEQVLYPETLKNFNNEECRYFSIIKIFKLKNYKLVFCVCTDRPHAIGILTLYRIRGEYESL